MHTLTPNNVTTLTIHLNNNLFPPGKKPEHFKTATEVIELLRRGDESHWKWEMACEIADEWKLWEWIDELGEPRLEEEI